VLRRGREDSTVMFVLNKEQKCEGKGTERDQCDTVSHQPVAGCTITDATGHPLLGTPEKVGLFKASRKKFGKTRGEENVNCLSQAR